MVEALGYILVIMFLAYLMGLGWIDNFYSKKEEMLRRLTQQEGKIDA